MKVLYAIQGTGNGHIVRAKEIIPQLINYAEVDVMMSGNDNEVDVGMPVKYKLNGLGFVFGKHGGINYRETLLQAHTFKFLKEVKDLPVKDYDAVINDFEPVSAWASKMRNVPIVGMSHQAAVIHPNSPHAKETDAFSKKILYNYAPVKESIGFHFKSYAPNIFTPVIRQDVVKAAVENKGHYTVYLPAYEDVFLIKLLSHFSQINWHVFSKRASEKVKHQNVLVQHVNANSFLESMRTGAGVLTGAGFETPAEVLYLGKKLLAIPMKGQYEQQCNAAALAQMGVPVLPDLNGKNVLETIGAWLSKEQQLNVQYPDVRKDAIEKVLRLIK